MQKPKKCCLSYSQLVFTMEFMISYSLNVLPSFQLQRVALVISVLLFMMHSWVSVQQNRQTQEKD